MAKIKQIPLEFKKNKLIYKLVKRTEKAVLYSVFNKEGVQYAWEVHKIRLKCVNAHARFDSLRLIGYTHFECLASNEEFGTYAWCYHITALNKAEERFIKLTLS